MKNFLYILILIFLFSGCSDVVSPPLSITAESEETITGVTINISSELNEARTKFPQAEFSGYVLEFYNNDDPYSPQFDTPIDASTTSITVPLTTRFWWVIAYGLVDGKRAAAGYGQINAELGTNQILPIHLGINLNGLDGTFTYDIEFPASPHGKDVTSASLRIYNYLTGEYLIGYGYYGYDNYDLLTEVRADSIPLKAGYYRVEVRLNNGYINVSDTEIIHIYPELETIYGKVFLVDDFTDYFTIGGTVLVTKNGDSSSNSIYVYAYRDSDSTQVGNAYAYYGINDTNEWTMNIAKSEENTPIYFMIDAYISLNNGNSSQWVYKEVRPSGVTMNKDDLNINLGTYNYNTIWLSGSVGNVSVNNEPVRYYISFRGNDDNISLSDNLLLDPGTTNWTREIVAFDTSTTVTASLYYFNPYKYIPITGEYGEYELYETTVQRQVHNASVTGFNFGNINITIPIIELSGTATVTSYDGTQLYAYVNIYKDSNYSNSVDSFIVDPYDTSWSKIYLVSETGTTLYFALSYYHPVTGEWTTYRINEPVTVSSSGGIISGMDLSTTVIWPPNNAALLPSDNWIDGNITTAKQPREDWYYFDINAYQDYHLWFNDYFYDYTKTLELYVRIYILDSSNNYISSDWFYPYSHGYLYSLYENFNGRVYIRVTGWNPNTGGDTGTYGIAYNTTGIRP